MMTRSDQDAGTAKPSDTASVAQPPAAPKYKPEHLYVFGGIAIGVMLGLLVAVAAWSFFRSRRRRAEADARQKDRLNIKHVGQDAWAESADRIKTPTVRELNKQHAPKNRGKRGEP